MQQSATFPCMRQENHQNKYQEESLVVERALQIIVNQREFSITMQTPGAERYLVRGLLHAEGFDHSEFNSYSQEEEENGTTVSVQITCKKPILDIRRLTPLPPAASVEKKVLIIYLSPLFPSPMTTASMQNKFKQIIWP